MTPFRSWTLPVAFASVLSFAPLAAAQPSPVTVDARAAGTPFPHFWETVFGSERGNITLRDSYRRDMREVKKVTAMEYVRFHAIFHDENAVYSEDEKGNPVYNFSYVDQIYDG